MGFFDRFKFGPKQPKPQSIEKQVLVPNFEVNEELEVLVREYWDASETLFGITHDYQIDASTDINSPRVQANPELLEMVGKYKEVLDTMSEIKNVSGEALREYLRPYTVLANPPASSLGYDPAEWDRFRVAKSLFKK